MTHRQGPKRDRGSISLEHLVVMPTAGLANRIRAIASAKRLSVMYGLRCTIVWDRQGYGALFESDPAIEVVSEILPDLPADRLVMDTEVIDAAGPFDNRCVPLDGPRCVVLTTCHCFGATTGPKSLSESDLVPWLPQPSRAVREKVDAFQARAFPSGNIVGLHLRRTDHEAAIVLSPDWLFVRRARAIIAGGGAIFLATDNQATQQAMLSYLDGNVVFFPKNPALAQRWPRPFNLEETIEDYTDLLLLASSGYVLGSAESSYSRLAMAINGSPKCEIVRHLHTGKRSPLDRVHAAGHEVRVVFFRLRQLRRQHHGVKFILAVVREACRRLRARGTRNGVIASP